MISRMLLPASVLLCFGLAAGCGSSSPTSSSSNTSSSVSPSEPASPSPSLDGSPESSRAAAVGDAPSLPAAAEGASTEAAQAFIQHWVDTLNYATDTGNTAALKKLAAEDCSACADFSRTLDQIYGAGGHVETDGWHLQSAVPLAGEPATEPGFQLALKLEPQKVFGTGDAQPQSYAGGDQAMRMFLLRRGDAWLVSRIDI